MRIRGFSDIQEAGSAAQQVVADLGLTALTVVGFSAAAGKVSCFVEIPSEGITSDPTAAFRTELRFRGYAEVMLSAGAVERRWALWICRGGTALLRSTRGVSASH